MNFKKTLAVISAILCMFLVACSGSNNSADKTTEKPAEKSSNIKVAGLKGPTTMGIVKLMEDNDKNQYEILGTAEEAAAKITKGEIDVALVPSNLAANLHNKDAGVVMAGINTLGVLNIVETGNTINSIQDLKGKTILSTGKGTTPEYTLNFLLSKNGIDPEKDVKIEYKSEATELARLLETQTDAIAVLPQPYATTVMMKNEKVRIALDFNDEWKKVAPDSDIVTGVILVRKEFLETNAENFSNFLKEYKASVNWVNENHAEAAKLIAKAEIAPEAVALKAIPKSNIVFITGEDMITKTNGYLQVLFDQNPKSIGGKMPDNNFFLK